MSKRSRSNSKHCLIRLRLQTCPSKKFRTIRVLTLEEMRCILPHFPINTRNWPSGETSKYDILFSSRPSKITIEPYRKKRDHRIVRLNILQTRIRSPSKKLNLWLFVLSFVKAHTLCEWTAKALARLHRCASSPQSLLSDYIISTLLYRLAQMFTTQADICD